MLWLVVSLYGLWGVDAVDRNKFKTCSQASFCKRNRFLQDGRQGPGYSVLADSLNVDSAGRCVKFKLTNIKYPAQDLLPVVVSFLNDETVRVQVTEENPLHPRWEASTPSADVLVPSTILPMDKVDINAGDESVVATFGKSEAVIFFEPFSIKLRREGKPMLSVNDLGLMNFEVYRPKDVIASSCQNIVFSGPENGKYLKDCPTGGCLTFATLQEGLDSCKSISDCGGIVMRPENGDLPYEMRKGTQLQQSPTQEQSYVKQCQDECKFTAFSPSKDGKTLSECLEENCKGYTSLSGAQKMCASLKSCGGIVKEGDSYNLRRGTLLTDSAESVAYLRVCSEEEPKRKVVAVKIIGHTGIHSFRMGTYRLVDTLDSGRGIFKHDAESYYLYHSESDGAWALGPNPRDSNVWMYLKSDSASPNEANGEWSYYDGDSGSWIKDTAMRAEVEEEEIEGMQGDIPNSEPSLAKYPPTEDGMWEESFGGHQDSKPRGPAAVALDVTYDGAEYVYGLAEHASPMALKNTLGSSGAYTDPYRLYNLDVFEYELDEPMALYGAIPLITAHSARGSASAFWLNSAETYIDVKDGDTGRVSHWISESGTIDLFLMVGSGPKDVIREYAKLTGFQALPQEFSLGYHQCRWNYKDEADVKAVDAGFDEHDIPYDTLWLDIEHTDGKKYFTWDSSLFPDPITMQNNLKAKGRKMVTIIDPHIKRDSGYHVHRDAEAQKLYVRDASGNKPYEGWCWPGSVSYLDFFNPNTLEYWADKFSFDQYKGSTDILYTWNDMNEPSVFNGPEVTMKKDALHWGDVEHRDVHNLYGMQVAKGTWHGQTKRLSKRPFVLTRSFFAGSQRFGAMWTGDNKADWGHLRDSVPMLLSMGISGFPFAGADVGGFFGDPDTELLLRWYQVGAFYPFFRGHGHIDTKRREPWLFGEPWTSMYRDAIRTRYRLLPYVYTLFYEANTEGVPVMRPLFMEFPDDESVLTKDDEFMLGDKILVKPVTEKGATTASVYFPDGVWYDWQTFRKFEGGRTVTVKAPLEKIPIYFRGGAITVTKERARRNSVLMKKDPYTLYITVDDKNSASGSLYLDDGESLDSSYITMEFKFGADDDGYKIAGSISSKKGDIQFANKIERVVIVGLSGNLPTGAVLIEKGSLDSTLVEVDNFGDIVTLRKPGASIDSEWVIKLT